MGYLTVFATMLADIALITSSTYLTWRWPTSALAWMISVLVFFHWASTGGFDMWTKAGRVTFLRNLRDRD